MKRSYAMTLIALLITAGGLHCKPKNGLPKIEKKARDLISQFAEFQDKGTQARKGLFANLAIKSNQKELMRYFDMPLDRIDRSSMTVGQQLAEIYREMLEELRDYARDEGFIDLENKLSDLLDDASEIC